MFDMSHYQTDYGKGAINKALKDGYAYFVPLYVIEGNTVQGLKIVPQLFDLTKMFGSGNEPSTIAEFEAMFTEDYYPYNEGTLMSMGTKEVVNVGKNMFKCENFSTSGLGGAHNPSLNNSYGTSIDSTEPSNKVTVTQSKIVDETNVVSYVNGYFCVSFNPIVLNDNYIVSFDVTPTKKLIENAKIIILLNGIDNIDASYNQDLQVGKTTRLYFNVVKRNAKSKYIEIRNSGISGIFENFQIEKGTTATAFSPYREATYPIPQEIQNLEGYGWGVNNVYNYVDYENKKFYKYVGKYVVTGDECFMSNENLGYIGNNSSNAYFVKSIEHKPSETTNSISNKLTRVPYCWSVDSTYNTMEFNGSQLHIRILNSELGTTSEATPSEVATAVKNYCKNLYDSGDPIIVYYELETPIITDISDIIGDTFQEPFEVEANGSLTFKNANGDGYRLAVPSNVQYTIKLNEVTS